MSNLLALIVAFSLMGASDEPLRMTAAGIVRSQDSPIPPFQIAAPFPGETAFKMVGRSEHRESSITSYGFLSSVAGIDQSVVFSQPGTPSAATARFTYFAQLDQPAEPTSGAVSVISAEGTLTVYFNEDGGSNLEAADSFFRGDPVATMQVQLQDVLHREVLEIGVIIGEGNLAQIFGNPFAFGGEEYRFGHVGLQSRFLYTGTTTSDEPGSQSFTASVAGRATVSGRQTTDDSGEGAMGTPAPASGEGTVSARGGDQTPSADAACEGVESWLAEAMANAEQAASIVAGIPASASVQSLDSAEVGDAAAGLAELAEAQRSAAVPELGLSANRLLVTALSTYSRGANLIERAVADQDEEALSRALDMLQDGKDLTDRALHQLTEIGTSCGIET